MFERLVPEALSAYSLAYETILDVQKGYRNEIYPILLTDGSMIQLTFYKSEDGMKDRIKRADSVAAFAASKGMPVRTRADNRTLTLTSKKRLVYVGLYNYLPGDTISWEAYTKDYLKQLGATMSNLHFALQGFDTTDQISVVDESIELANRMQRYFGDANVKEAMSEKLNLTFTKESHHYNHLLEKLCQLPSQQLHMDFVRGNILFKNDQLRGILDFEKTAVGPPLFDIARTLAFLLVDCKYKTETQVRKYFLQSGYHKRGAAALYHYPHTLEMLIEFFLIHDFYKFLRHNPYENLGDNEHFTRTVSILTRRGVLHYI